MSEMAISIARRRRPPSLVRLKQAARKLFVERGYDATRPQDIAKEAGLGHGTFYLHYPDKRACFLSFIEDARRDLDAHLRAAAGATLEERIAAALDAMLDFCDRHPGLFRAALMDERLIDADGKKMRGVLMQWGDEWGEMIRRAAGEGSIEKGYDAAIIGQAIVGALCQTGWEAHYSGRCRKELVQNLTRFLVRALRPD